MQYTPGQSPTLNLLLDCLDSPYPWTEVYEPSLQPLEPGGIQLPNPPTLSSKILV